MGTENKLVILGAGSERVGCKEMLRVMKMSLLDGDIHYTTVNICINVFICIACVYLQNMCHFIEDSTLLGQGYVPRP